MRQIDFFAGKPIVLLLGILNKIKKSLLKVSGVKFVKLKEETFFFQGEIREKYSHLLKGEVGKKFVIAKFFGLGSIILTSPLIQEIKSENPENQIIFLTFHQNKKLLDTMEGVDEVITIRTESFFKFLKDVIYTVINLRRKRIDFFYDLEFFSKFSAILGFLSGAKVKVGFWSLSEKRGGIQDIKIRYNRDIHIVENFLMFNRVLGIKDKKGRNWKELLRTALRREKIEEIEKKFIGKYKNLIEKSKQMKIVAVNPFPSEVMSELREWEPEKWKEVIKRVSYDSFVVVLGTGENENKISYSDISSEKVLNLIGKTSFEEFLFLIHISDIVITLDSFPLHLGFSMGKKIISLFGPDSPRHYGYQGEDGVSTIYKEISCSPCINIFKGKLSDIKCNNNLCMKMISSEEVIQTYKIMTKDR